jgi:zinc transporter, ZIP family
MEVMSELTTILLYSWIAGVMAFVGGVLAYLERFAETESKQEVVHSVVAFGGGILLSAVAFTLTPAAMKFILPNILFVVFCLGGITFCIIDYLISRCSANKAQFMAMLLDFVPEALALGVIWVYKPKLGILLALYIGFQNLPEGFNAFRELVGAKTKHILSTLFLVSLLGPISAGIGYFFLQDHKYWTAMILAFASGGILYLIFQDIAPASTMKKHRTPPLGAVLGFAVGMVAKQFLG